MSLRVNSFILVLSFCFSFAIQADVQNYYSYSDAKELSSGNEIDRDLIYTIKVASSKNFKTLGYKRRSKKELHGFVHLEEDNEGYFVFDVYCEKKIRSNVGPHRIPTNRIMNTEHTWPQSKGAKSEPKRGDLHHLYPTDSRANSVRSSHPFGEVSGKDAHSNCSASQIGNMIDPYSGKTSRGKAFQPPVNHRGNVARALFYFAAKYNYRIQEYEEYYLKKWHLDDPVDDEERQRNDRIESVQGNRNPFVDFPDIVARISDF